MNPSDQLTTPQLGPSTLTLDASHLRKRFGAHVAVDDVSLTLRAGERLALLGPNGAGKTTTLLMLLGAVRADSGAVTICGINATTHRAAALEKVGFVAGYLPLPQHLTVFEALDFFASLYGMRRGRRAAIDAALSQFRITQLADQACESLSSGQRTLVGICKAVLHRPQLVVLDEPTASLDPDVARRAREGLLALSEHEGTALLVTSHNMVEVERLCERVCFINEGRIVADGTPAQISAQFDQVDLEGVFLQLAATGRNDDAAIRP